MVKENGATQQKYDAFCLEYISNGYNQTKAYMAVYPNAAPRTAQKQAYRLMRDPYVSRRIDELIKEKYKMLHINAETIAMKLQEMAFAEKDDEIYTPSVALKALDMLQKQLGLQRQKIDANVDQVTTISVSIEDE